MNVTILGTNGFLSRAIALYCNVKGYPVDMYGLDEPKGCFGSAQRADVGMKYLALDGRKLKSLTGFEATVRLEDVIKILTII